MAGRFPPAAATKLIAECHRRCCVCHRFCGSKLELDHIVPGAEDGEDAIENAIPVCFDCHAEIHAYNDKHPRGRKFQPEELRLHKAQWLEICRTRPSVFDGASGRGQAGPLEAILDELEFNIIATRRFLDAHLCPLMDDQFRRAISSGSVTLLDEPVRNDLLDAYAAAAAANQFIEAVLRQPHLSNGWGANLKAAREVVPKTLQPLQAARAALRRFLGATEDEDSTASEAPIASPPVVTAEDRCREWAYAVRDALASGHHGNVAVVADADRPCAEWAVKAGILAHDPIDGRGVTLPMEKLPR